MSTEDVPVIESPHVQSGRWYLIISPDECYHSDNLGSSFERATPDLLMLKDHRTPVILTAVGESRGIYAEFSE